MFGHPRPSSGIDAPGVVTRGRWTAPPRQPAPRAPWAPALLLGVLGLLLVVGLGKFAADAMAAPQDDVGAAAAADPCASSGLIPLGDTGLCTHGPDPQ